VRPPTRAVAGVKCMVVDATAAAVARGMQTGDNTGLDPLACAGEACGLLG
jgi:hypothetical protein